MDYFASLAMASSSAVAIPHQFRAIVRQRRGDLRLLWLGGPPIRGRFAPGCGRLVRGLFAGHVVILLFVHDNIFADVAFLSRRMRG
jgi:hypothetical protein